jgi:hypothetical protein
LSRPGSQRERSGRIVLPSATVFWTKSTALVAANFSIAPPGEFSLSSGEMPSLVGSTAKAAVLISTGQVAGIAGSVVVLMQIGAKAMFLAKLKATLATVVVLAFVGGGRRHRACKPPLGFAEKEPCASAPGQPW